MQCFCDQTEFSHDHEYLHEGQTGKICETYFYEKQWAKYSSQALGIIIQIINLALKYFTKMIVLEMGCRTDSEEMSYTGNWIFIAIWLNSGWLLMIANANLTDQNIPILSRFLSYGIDPDFNNRWFLTVGNTVISSQIFSIFSPIIENITILSKFIMGKIKKKCKSRKAENEPEKENLTYFEASSRKQYSLDSKYSTLLNSVFVTMMFGPAIPILFPIACIYFCVMYGVEKLMLKEYYDEIPAYDNKLNDQALKTMLLAPFMLYSFGYWFLSNKQLLSNDHLIPKISTANVYDSQHNFWSSLFPKGEAQPAFMLLFCSYVMIGVLVFSNFGFLADALQKIPVLKNLLASDADFDVRENIGIYWNALNQDDVDRSVAEEESCRSKFRIETMFEGQVQALTTNRYGRLQMQGIPSYDIMMNDKYCQMLGYKPVAMDNAELSLAGVIEEEEEAQLREERRNMSDLVKIALRLPFMKADFENHFVFDKNYIR